MASKKIENREAWLGALADKMLPELEARGVELNGKKLRYSCGFPGGGQRSAIGQCWVPDVSADGTTEIFVSPIIDDPDRVADILAHELIHASGIMGHKVADFGAKAKALGLMSPWTATTAGPEFKQWSAPLLASMPAYPHGALSDRGKIWKKLKPGETPPWGGSPKQTTRLLKVLCEEGHDPYIARMTRKALDFGYPLCPCGATMHESG